KYCKVELGEPIFGDKYIVGKRLDNKTTKIIENINFKEDEVGFQVFNNGWNFISNKDKKDGKLIVEIAGKNIFLVYKKSIKENAGKIYIKVNGNEDISLDTHFKDGWGDWSRTELLVEDSEFKKHTIEIAVKNEGKPSEVTLMGFLVS
ncbi:MAG: SGNH/GDSL hydrolase family protein, partial [Clostridium sp.]